MTLTYESQDLAIAMLDKLRQLPLRQQGEVVGWIVGGLIAAAGPGYAAPINPINPTEATMKEMEMTFVSRVKWKPTHGQTHAQHEARARAFAQAQGPALAKAAQEDAAKGGFEHIAPFTFEITKVREIA